MSTKGVDIDHISKRLRGVRLAADVQARFRTPGNGGRPTDPAWEERRLVPLTNPTLARLEKLATAVTKASGQEVSAMQVAALLLEKAAQQAREEDAAALLERK